MARRKDDPEIAAIREAQRAEAREVAAARRKAFVRWLLTVLLAAAVAGAVGWWIIAHSEEIANQTPPADCTPPAVDLGCGGVQTR